MDRVVGALLPVSRIIDACNSRIGRILSWLVLAAVLVSAINATVRKLFDLSANWALELQWVLFGAVFLLCSPWTLAANEHIRIDIINNMLPKAVRNWIDLVGHAVFLLPLTIVMTVTGLPFFIRSYSIDEQSFSAGGLPQWPAKGLVLAGFVLLLLQAISEIIKRIAVMRGLIPDPHVARPSLEVEAEHLMDVMERR